MITDLKFLECSVYYVLPQFRTTTSHHSGQLMEGELTDFTWTGQLKEHFVSMY